MAVSSEIEKALIHSTQYCQPSKSALGLFRTGLRLIGCVWFIVLVGVLLAIQWAREGET